MTADSLPDSLRGVLPTPAPDSDSTLAAPENAADVIAPDIVGLPVKDDADAMTLWGREYRKGWEPKV